MTVLPPQKAQCPFHSHHGEEEVFLILEGEGSLRFGDERHPIRKHDVIARPPGGSCEYPDSRKISIVAGERGKREVRKMFRAENTVDYYDRERS